MIWHLAMFQTLRLAMTFCVVSVAVGCVMVPVDFGSDEPLYGNEISPTKLDSLKIGQSTKEEVGALMGRPTIDLQEYRLLAYVWVFDTARWLVISGFGTPTVQVAESHIVFLAFDERDVLIAKARGQTPGLFGSVMESARDWMVANDVKPPPQPTYPPWSVIPNDKGVIVVRRNGSAPGGALTYTAWDPTAIALDGQYRAELTDETYIALICDSGRHSVSADARPPYRETSHTTSIPSYRVSQWVDVPPGEVVFLRTQSGTGTGSIEVVLERMTRKAGEEVMQDLEPTW